MFAPLPTPEEMTAWDRAAAEYGLPALLLMENASREALHVLVATCGPVAGRRILLLMGGGNNGGDAAALARHLFDLGADVLVVHTRPLGSYRGETGAHMRIARRCGVPFMGADAWLRSMARHATPDIAWHIAASRVNPGRKSGTRHCEPHPEGTAPPAGCTEPLLIVDGLMGTGLAGPLRERERRIVGRMNALRANGARILALDIPSGLDGLTGEPSPVAVHADVTVTFEALKPGLILPGAAQHTGEVHVRPIGIPVSVRDHPTRFRLLTDTCREALPPPHHCMHKGHAGHVLVLGGSPGLTGAPHLAAQGSLRGGAGFVTVAAPGALAAEIKAGCPDIMTLPLGEGTDWTACTDERLAALALRCDAIVAGPGMGRTSEAARTLRMLLSLAGRPPAVIDADALHAFATGELTLDLIAETDIVTPHPGEAARLLGWETVDVQRDRPAALAVLMARMRGTVVLKGACTLVGSPGVPVTVSPRIAPTLAVAGSGDVLAGLAGALVAQGVSSPIAACLSVNIHGKAGELLLEGYPERGCTASDIAATLPRARKELCHA